MWSSTVLLVAFSALMVEGFAWYDDELFYQDTDWKPADASFAGHTDDESSIAGQPDDESFVQDIVADPPSGRRRGALTDLTTSTC